MNEKYRVKIYLELEPKEKGENGRNSKKFSGSAGSVETQCESVRANIFLKNVKGEFDLPTSPRRPNISLYSRADLFHLLRAARR